MKLLKSAINRLLKSVSRHIAYGKLKRSSASDASPTGKIVKALREAIKNEVDPSERNKLEKIESVRRELNDSEEEVLIVDYGAGKSDSSRTEEEMLSGVTHTTTVANASKASKAPFWSLILYKLLRAFKPAKCIELGSCVGISAAYQATALQINGNGALITMEGAESLAAISERTLKRLDLDNARVVIGKFQDNLERVLTDEAPIDYVFIDGHHDELATLKYYEMCLPYLSESAIIVFDDISWSAGMRRAWSKIAEDENVKLAFDLRTIGICLFDKGLIGKEFHRFALR